MAADQSSKRVQLISDATDLVYAIHMQVLPNRKGLLLATGSYDCKVRLYSSALNKSILQFKLRSHVMHKCGVQVVEFNRTGTSLLSAGEGDLIVSDVRNIASPKRITMLKHLGDVVGACWSSTGDAIIGACVTNTILILDMKTKDFPCNKYHVASKGELFAMAYSGNSITVGDNSGCLFRFAFHDPSHDVYRIAQQLQAHTGGIAVYNGIDMLSDGICVSAGHDAKSVLIWDVKSNKTEKIKHPDHVTAVHVPVKGGNLFFTACCDGFVRLFDRRYNPTRELFKLQMIGSPYSVTSCVVPGQQGGLFAVGCYNGTCEVYRCLSLRLVTDQICAFLMGFHTRVGSQSSVLRSFARNFTFETNLLPLISSYLH